MSDRYAKIQSSIWGSKRFDGLTRLERLVYLYLLTNEHNNSIGLYELKAKYALVDLKCAPQSYRKALEALAAAGVIGVDQARETVFLQDYLRFNPLTNPKHAKGSVRLALRFLDSPLYPLFLRDINKYCPRYAGLFLPAGDSLSIGYRYTDTETETDTDTETETDTDTDTETAAAAAAMAGETLGAGEGDEICPPGIGESPGKDGGGNSGRGCRRTGDAGEKATPVVGAGQGNAFKDARGKKGCAGADKPMSCVPTAGKETVARQGGDLHNCPDGKKSKAGKLKEDRGEKQGAGLLAGGSDRDGGFEDFWRIYPRKEARGLAEKAWRAALKQGGREAVLAGCQAYAQYHAAAGTGERYLKSPANWLEGRCWEDKPPPLFAKQGEKAVDSCPYSVIRDRRLGIGSKPEEADG